MLESEGPGGAEVVVVHLAEELRRRGHAVVPVVLTRRDEPGWLERRYRELGFVPERIVIRRTLDWRCLQDIIAMLRRRRATAVHSHEFGMAIYGTAACRWLKIPHVLTLHGNRWMTDAWRRRAALRWAIRRSHATAVSEHTRQHLLSALGGSARKIRTVLNGIPHHAGDRTRVRHELGLGDDTVLVSAVGNLIERKGHAVLIRAFADVLRDRAGQPWRLVIAGEGVERPRLEALIAELGVGSSVTLLGHRSDVADVLAASDVFVMPSLWEGLPLAVLEAMFARNAIIASKASGIPEAIPTPETGRLVTPGDAVELAAALRDILEHGNLRAALGSAAAARAHAQFEVGTMTEQYERLYLGSGA
jgi:glycosyltransferase involved in cell wall biosynthesis